MSRITFVRNVNTVIPLIGIPLKNYINTYVATKVDSECTLRVSYRLTKCQKEVSQRYRLSNSLDDYINGYLNSITMELLDMCIDGHIDIECRDKVPDIVMFVIGTTEVLLNTFKIKRIEYEDYLQTFGVLDSKFWGVEPSYIVSLRCAYMYRETCICRNIHDIVRLGPVNVVPRYVNEYSCGYSSCLELTSPFDNVATLYLTKLTSHVVSKVAQDLIERNCISRPTLKYLNLLHNVEARAMFEAVDVDSMPKDIDLLSVVKPVADIASIKLYNLGIGVCS